MSYGVLLMRRCSACACSSLAARCCTRRGTVDKPSKPEILRAIGILIKQHRIERGQTQRQLAAVIGLSRPSVVNMEQGNQGISITTLYAIARALEIDVTQLIPIDTNATAITKIPISGLVEGT